MLYIINVYIKDIHYGIVKDEEGKDVRVRNHVQNPFALLLLLGMVYPSLLITLQVFALGVRGLIRLEYDFNIYVDILYNASLILNSLI